MNLQSFICFFAVFYPNFKKWHKKQYNSVFLHFKWIFSVSTETLFDPSQKRTSGYTCKSAVCSMQTVSWNPCVNHEKCTSFTTLHAHDIQV